MPVKTDLYGFSDCQKSPFKISNSSLTKDDHTGKLIEFPLCVGKFLRKTYPAAGGFYLRFLPLSVSLNAIKHYEEQNIPATIYIHSWELTPEFIPKIELPFKEKFVTFHNIKNTYSRMEEILQKFSFSSVKDFLDNDN